MDISTTMLGVFGTLKLIQASTELRCIACEHIGWNETYTFNNVRYIYHLLQTKYNPACAQANPRDRNAYEQAYEKQIQQQQPFLNGQNYRQRYDVRDVFCQDQCTYVFGDVTTYFIPFGGSMKLNIHLRYCLDSLTHIKDGCYQRDTTSGYEAIKIKLQQELEFLGGAEVVNVVRFVGKQCYCSRDFCYHSKGASTKTASIPIVALALYVYFTIK